jgi:peptidoglycan/LPS O-acetylase OafA/YrhL
MLDLYRFILSLFVVQGHLLAWGSPILAWQAVFSFYVLSGFLMTLVLNEQYGATLGGLCRFGLNRILRLFPVYWAIIGLTVLHIAIIGPLTQLNGAIEIPRSPYDVLANLMIFPLTGVDFSQMAQTRLVPTAWSLSIELVCYALLALWFSRSPRRLLLMLALGLGFSIVQIAGAIKQPDYGFQSHYSVYQAGLLPFAIGGLAYFVRRAHVFAFSWTKVALIVLLLCMNVAAGYFSDFHKYVTSLYCSSLLNLFLVPTLFQRAKAGPGAAVCGGLAYPIFVSHWLVGTLIIVYIPTIAARGSVHFVLSTAATIVFSSLLYFGVDRQVQRVRAFIKLVKFAAPGRRRPSLAPYL